MMNDMEIWKDVEGYPNYQVSNMGRVKSLKFGKERILKSGKNKWGYVLVALCKDGKQKTFKVHRLVASAFIPNPNNLSQINHIDEDKTNNRVDNLEYCDCKYNINYGNHNEKMAKSKSMPVLQFSKTGEFIRKWDGLRQVERELGISHNHICSCLKGRYKTAGDFIWGYADDYERIPFKVFDLELYRKKVA